MKIIIIIPTASSVNAFLKEQIKYLHDNKNDIHLICGGEIDEDIKDKCCHIKLEMPRSTEFIKYVKAIYKIRKVVEMVRPNIIHVHFSAAAFLVAIAKGKNWPYMITTIQGVVYTASKGIKRFLSKKAELYAFRKFNRTYVLTEDDYTALSLEGIDVLCQNSPGFGCDINRFNRENYSSTEIENIKNKLNIPKTHHVLIYIGRLVAFKGINVALKAFIELNKINNDVTFVVCGDFDKIHSSGLSDSEKNILMHHANIRYVGFTDKISDYLAIADLNIFPSIREGLPVNLMESLAMSVPVITNNARGCRDIVEDGINGYVLKSRHYTEYMKKISTLIKDQMKLNQLKINCTLSRQRFDRINYIIEYDNLYKQIVNM